MDGRSRYFASPTRARSQITMPSAFISGDEAVFVRVMTRPEGDAATAIATIERILDLLEDHVELNEFKRTSIPR